MHNPNRRTNPASDRIFGMVLLIGSGIAGLFAFHGVLVKSFLIVLFVPMSFIFWELWAPPKTPTGKGFKRLARVVVGAGGALGALIAFKFTVSVAQSFGADLGINGAVSPSFIAGFTKWTLGIISAHFMVRAVFLMGSDEHSSTTATGRA